MQTDRIFDDNFYRFHSENWYKKLSKSDIKLMQNDRFLAIIFIVFTAKIEEKKSQKLT
jgi:hypothetical protein